MSSWAASKPPGPTLARVLDHMRAEGERGATSADDALLSFSQVAETLDRLEVILDDHEEAQQAFLDAFAGPGETLQAPLVNRRHASVVLNLRVETFYLFARILLDQVARAVRGAFGRPGRGITLSGHTELTKNLAAYAADKGLAPLPGSLSRMIEQVSSDIVDIRDHYVAHDAKSGRVKGTTFNRAAGEATMLVGSLPVSAAEPGFTVMAPPDLMRTIDAYLEAIIEYINLNRTVA
jgi:hypothetical protein